jgi:hypothetical protein
LSEDEPFSEEEEESVEDAPPKKKTKTKTTPKQKPKPKPKPHSPSPLESSDDDLPLRPGPSDEDVKSAVLEFLKSKDLSTVTKGMVKDALRTKYGEAVVKNKKEAITQGIEEGMEM